MTYEFIKERLAPCGLHCGKCFAFTQGDVGKYSKALQTELGEFDVYAERFDQLLDKHVLEKYPAFKDMLNEFTQAQCQGCRKEMCKLFKDCKVRGCAEEKKVDFCFECTDFPCSNTGFDKHLEQRSVNINLRIREIGVEKYYQEIKDTPRY